MMYEIEISSPREMVRRALIWDSLVSELKSKHAFGEHEWLNLEAFKQIPESSSEIENVFVLNMPCNGT